MLKQQLKSDQIQALKAKDVERLSTIRYILSQIQNKEIQKQGELTDEDIVVLLQKIVKELTESRDAAKGAGRDNMFEEAEKQLTITQSYLPPELSEDELQSELKKIIDENKGLTNSNALIGISMKQLKGKASPQRIMETLKSLV